MYKKNTQAYKITDGMRNHVNKNKSNKISALTMAETMPIACPQCLTPVLALVCADGA